MPLPHGHEIAKQTEAAQKIHSQKQNIQTHKAANNKLSEKISAWVHTS